MTQCSFVIHSLMGSLLAVPPYRLAPRQDGPVQHRLHRSTRLWTFYADMMESLETVKRTAAVYDRMLDLKVATPQVLLLCLTPCFRWQCWRGG